MHLDVSREPIVDQRQRQYAWELTILTTRTYIKERERERERERVCERGERVEREWRGRERERGIEGGIEGGKEGRREERGGGERERRQRDRETDVQ
jgi:hypothetical protein